jgi:acetyl-CoA acetyltransferase
MDFLRDRGVAIIGYSDTKLVRRSGRSALSLAGEALDALFARTGIERERVDGFATTLSMSEAGNPFWSNLLAEGLGLSIKWCQATDIGGASVVGNVARAAMAIHSGACEMAVCLAADAPTTQEQSRQGGARAEFCDPVGYAGPMTAFALLSSAYDALHGLPERALAKLAVTQRRGALLNERACEALRKPLAEEDYFASRFVSDPLRVLDCVMRCDGASALLVTSSRLARQLGFSTCVHPIAYRERINYEPRRAATSILESGFAEVGTAALKAARMSPCDVGSLHAYDDFLIALVLQLEQIGFCKSGQGGGFILGHDLGVAGDLPLNTGGGQVSSGQPGLAGGGVNMTEALVQLFGDGGARQVGNRETAMVTGIGFIQYGRNWGASNVMLLERRQ